MSGDPTGTIDQRNPGAVWGRHRCRKLRVGAVMVHKNGPEAS